MSHVVWRIATDTPDYEADDLTGEGARRTGGRWNAPGAPATYTSESRALACLETMIHLNAGGLPLNRYLVAVTLPDELWAEAYRTTVNDLPVGWDAAPAGRASIRFGTEWITTGRSALLLVPSVIVPEECNILINPSHPASASIIATKVRKWLYDSRLGRGD